MALFPTFSTSGTQDRRRLPTTTFYPATSNDGFAVTVKQTQAPYLQAGVGLQAGLPVAYRQPNQNIQNQRVYSPSRLLFPTGW
jgi:hypothetical protein